VQDARSTLIHALAWKPDEIATLRKQLIEAKLVIARFLSVADLMGESGGFVDALNRIRESRKALQEIAKLPLGDHRAKKIAEAAIRPGAEGKKREDREG